MGAYGDIVDVSFAEVLDKDGNFYTENYRNAKSTYKYICKEGIQEYCSHFTFYGFRYLRINQYPGGLDKIDPSAFTAIVIHSNIKRTGYLSCGEPHLNKLFQNIIWGQKGNFVDVPTDCPQRDERLGWTGDAQAFVRTAALNFNVEKFFTKWLHDLSAEQTAEGGVWHVIPNYLEEHSSAAWGDAATICPWQIYLAYGNLSLLEDQYESMCNWLSYIKLTSTTPHAWTGGKHFGDWLGLDAPSGSYKGSTNEDFIATAFYAYSTMLTIKAGKALKKDTSHLEASYTKIVETFRTLYPIYETQTEHVLALYFELTTTPQEIADTLAKKIVECGIHLETGFVGTPYLLHVLSSYGYIELAYSLLLRKEYPSWLYPVTKGATTIWEHWDGIMENGEFWSSDMNSYNHYAYGAVADWIYTVAAGINSLEEAPGYNEVLISPHPDKRLGWLEASLSTKHGLIRSRWEYQMDISSKQQIRYEIEVPVNATLQLEDVTHILTPGTYIFTKNI